MDSSTELLKLLLLHQILFRSSLVCLIFILLRHRQNMNGRRPRRVGIRYSLISRIPKQVKYLDKLLNTGDIMIRNSLRMNRDSFMRLCNMLYGAGDLQPTKYVGISEQVSIFLDVLSHHTKNRIIGRNYRRSGETVSKCFNSVLVSVIKLHSLLLSKPQPVAADEQDYTWKYFQGCLGALDGTFIDVRVPIADKPRYRSRKGAIATNVLAVCDRNGLFVYVLAGWEGSAADSRVLKDAIYRTNGFKVPLGSYYLADNGYTNGEGFLTPYRGIRYHLQEWGDGRRAPQNYKEYYNMKHSKARNIIERTFGVLKQRWAILRSNSFFPVHTQNHIILSCCLLHNFIRREMGDAGEDELEIPEVDDDNYVGDGDVDYVDVVQPSDTWNAFRENLAQEMFNDWQSRR